MPLLLRAYELWRELEGETGEDLMTLCGGLMIGREGGDLVPGSVKSADEHGLPYEMLDAREVRRRFPPFNPDPGTVALYEEKAGFVRPEASVKAHLDRAAALGADLRFGEPVLRWEASADKVRVRTAGGAYEAEKLVVAPGAWAPELLAELSLPLQVERQVMYWFEPDGATGPFLPERFPVWIWELDDGNMFYGFPAVEGDRGVKAAFFRAGGVPCTPETIDREVGQAEVDFIRGYLEEHVPAMAGRCLHARACMYTNTPDEHFVICAHPEHPRVVVACGFSGHGYKFCSVVGEILSDLALEGETRHPIGLFSPDRLTHAG